MPLTLPRKDGTSHTVTGADYQAQQERELRGPDRPAPVPEEDMNGLHTLESDVWVDRGDGVQQKLYRHGTKIPDEEAIRLGLKKAPKPTNKKLTPENKKG